MKQFIAILLVFAALGGIAFGSGSMAEKEAAVLEELLEMENAALDPYYGESDPTLYADQFADRATYFDPWSGGRLDDAAIKEYLMAFMGAVPKMEYKILNARVDLYRKTAILTFNLDAIDPSDGSVTKWNVTLVYTKSGDGWAKVHANWSYTEGG